VTLDIKIRLVSGSELKFTCNDQEARDLIEVAGPTRLGLTSRITVSAEDSSFLFPAIAIERLDFINGKLPPWRPPAGTKEMRVMTEDTWKARLAKEGSGLAEMRAKAKRGEWCPGFAKVWLMSGSIVYLRFTEIIGAPPDKPHAQKSLFGGRPIHAENDEGGWTVLNGANMLAVRVFPKGELVLESDWKAAARNGNGNGLLKKVTVGESDMDHAKTDKIDPDDPTVPDSSA